MIFDWILLEISSFRRIAHINVVQNQELPKCGTDVRPKRFSVHPCGTVWEVSDRVGRRCRAPPDAPMCNRCCDSDEFFSLQFFSLFFICPPGYLLFIHVFCRKKRQRAVHRGTIGSGSAPSWMTFRVCERGPALCTLYLQHISACAAAPWIHYSTETFLFPTPGSWCCTFTLFHIRTWSSKHELWYLMHLQLSNMELWPNEFCDFFI